MNIFKIFKREKEVIPDAEHGRYAKVEISREGERKTYPQGAKYPIRGIPRGDFLKGVLDPIKRKITNVVDDMGDIGLIVSIIKSSAWRLVYGEISEQSLSEPVKEIARVFNLKIEDEKTEDGKTEVRRVKKFGCAFLEEDTAYRYRIQWAIEKINIRNLMSDPVGEIARVFDLIIKAENKGMVHQGMKEKMRRFKKFSCNLLEKNPIWCNRIQCILSRIDKKKTNLTKGDKYYFRAKYFDVDL